MAARTEAPIRLKTRPKNQPREPLFSIDGVDYTMPVKVPFGTTLSLSALLLPIQPDEDAKGMVLVRELCGQQALEALLRDATMTRAEWDTITRILSEKAFGPAEGAEA